MLLRALQRLNIGIERGEVFSAARLKPDVCDRLLVRGIVVPVNAPPIAALSEFGAIADLLVAAGIETPADLIEAKAVEGLTAEELQAWQAKARAALVVNHPCRACSR
jgi:hypothetical protein